MQSSFGTGESTFHEDGNDLAQTLAAAVLLTCILGLAFIYVIGAYLQRSSIENLLSFFGPDGVPPYDGVTLPKPWGVHYFGDYLLPHWQSNMKDPWVYKEFGGPQINNYLPFTMGVFWLFGRFSYWRGFILFEITSLTLFFVPAWMALRRFACLDRIELIASTVLLTGPFISLLDRGNAQLMLIGTCGLALVLVLSNRPRAGAVVLGLAIALKGYPIFFLLLWLVRRRIKDALVSCIVAAIGSLVPLFFYEGGVVSSLKSILRNVRTWENAYPKAYVSYNQSLRGSLNSIGALSLGRISSLATRLEHHFSILMFLLIFVSLWLFFQRGIYVFEQVLILCSLVIVSVGYVAPYAVGVFLLPIITSWIHPENINSKWIVIYSILVAILLAPKGFPVTFWRDKFDYQIPTYGSLFTGPIALTLLVVVCVRLVSIRRTKDQLPSAQAVPS